MKYQAFRPHFFSVGGWWGGVDGVGVVGWEWWGGGWWGGGGVGSVGGGVHGVLVRDVVGGGGRVSSGMGDGVLSGW